MRLSGLLCSLLVVAAVTGCDPGTPVAVPAPSSSAASASSGAPGASLPPAAGTPSSAARPAPAPPAPPVAGGKVIVIDPGHNGGNAAHPSTINRLVPAGRGVRKPCNTTGTATDGGYPEHAFNWDVAMRAAKLLSGAGFRVILTRNSDTGVGPCVDQRAAVGNRAHAAAVVSIHADGATSPSAHGFHVSYPSPPLNPEQGAPSATLADMVRDSMLNAGLTTSTYLGSGGIYPRSDLGGLNLSDRPSVLVECGNMRNPAEAAAFTSPAGRQRYAAAIAGGIVAFLR